jgi:hypothetical protein
MAGASRFARFCAPVPAYGTFIQQLASTNKVYAERSSGESMQLRNWQVIVLVCVADSLSMAASK